MVSYSLPLTHALGTEAQVASLSIALSLTFHTVNVQAALVRGLAAWQRDCSTLSTRLEAVSMAYLQGQGRRGCWSAVNAA